MDECLNFLAKPKCYKNPILLLLLLCTKWDNPPKVKITPINYVCLSFKYTHGKLHKQREPAFPKENGNKIYSIKIQAKFFYFLV